jgi:hypothetical protein
MQVAEEEGAEANAFLGEALALRIHDCPGTLFGDLGLIAEAREKRQISRATAQ